MPEKPARIEHLRRVLEALKGREHKVILLEVANEAWQNGFPGEQGIADLREFGKYLSDRTQVLVALSAPEIYENDGIAQMYQGSAADIATVHSSRDTRTAQGSWLSVRDPWRVNSIRDIPPVSSNEPIGPGSSVASENDPTKLVCAATFAWMSGLPMYVYHSEAGVFGESRFQDQPAIDRFAPLLELLPRGIANWRRCDGDAPDSPLRIISPRPHGLPHLIACTRGEQFIALVIGVGEAGVELQTQRPIDGEVFDLLTTESIAKGTKAKGERFALGRGAGAYLLKGTVRAK
jgi:hypothetical protein